jgi:DNA-directed RNA polymerase specialized sigma24 family protein
MLGAQFPRLTDPEEIYQDAWAELLELERSAERVRHPRALLKTIAWRRAADVVKQRRRVVAVDPGGLVLENTVDARAQPDEEAQRHLDGEALRLVVESLDEREAAANKLKFDCQLSAKEVQDVLGVGEKLLELVVSTAYRKIAEQLEVGEDGTTTWTRRQRSLLLACELGIASSRQRRRAQRMLDHDPAFRGLLRAMRRGLDDVAAVLPVPVIADEHERFRRLVGATGRLSLEASFSQFACVGRRHSEAFSELCVRELDLVLDGVEDQGQRFPRSFLGDAWQRFPRHAQCLSAKRVVRRFDL